MWVVLNFVLFCFTEVEVNNEHARTRCEILVTGLSATDLLPGDTNSGLSDPYVTFQAPFVEKPVNTRVQSKVCFLFLFVCLSFCF